MSVRTQRGRHFAYLDLNCDQSKQLGPASCAPVVVSMRRQCLILLQNFSMRVARTIAMRTEADRFPTIAFRWEVERALFVAERPDPAGIVTAISKPHGSRSQTAQRR